MSNQLRGQGALWTERDKRPCVRYGLLIYLALHPHAERTPRSLVRGAGGGVSSRSPAAARPLAAGSAARARTGARLTASLRGPAAGTGPDSPGSSAARLSAPTSPGPRAQRRLKTARELLSPQPQSQECTRDSGVATGSPAPRPPRVSPTPGSSPPGPALY